MPSFTVPPGMSMFQIDSSEPLDLRLGCCDLTLEIVLGPSHFSIKLHFDNSSTFNMPNTSNALIGCDSYQGFDPNVQTLMENMHPISHTSTSGSKSSSHAPENTRGYSQVDSSPESDCEHLLEHATTNCLKSQMQPDPYPKSPHHMLINRLEGLGSFTQKLKAQESNEVTHISNSILDAYLSPAISQISLTKPNHKCLRSDNFLCSLSGFGPVPKSKNHKKF